MKTLNGVCMVSRDLPRARRFYETILQMKFEGDEKFAWLTTLRGTLSIFSDESMEKMAPGSMSGAGYGSYTIEFEVEEVDREFERLRSLGVEFVKEPTTQSRGRRSVWFRDPDGNIVNFYKSVV